MLHSSSTPSAVCPLPEPHEGPVDPRPTFRDLFKNRMNPALLSSLKSCAHCGLCAQACHYALSRPGDPALTPVYKADRIRRLLKQPRPASSSSGAVDLRELKDIVFGTCSTCRRCTAFCPMGVDTAALIRLARGVLTELGLAPEGLTKVCELQRNTGNQMAIGQEEFFSSLKWIEGELRAESGYEEACIPIDRYDSDFLYVLNPREIKFDPRSLVQAAKIFHAAGASWTLSSQGWDLTNFGLFSGDNRLGAAVSRRIYAAAQNLRAKSIVTSECGHGYRCTRFEGYTWAAFPQQLPVESVVVTILRFLDQGRIKVDPARNPEPVTFHDSCNLARYADLIEEPRRLLKAVCLHFREMQPNRGQNFCCTGGGGLLVMPEYRPLRLEASKIKAEQLRATGTQRVCASCHNCLQGLSEVIEHHDLNMWVVQILELAANALIDQG